MENLDRNILIPNGTSFVAMVTDQCKQQVESS